MFSGYFFFTTTSVLAIKSPILNPLFNEAIKASKGQISKVIFLTTLKYRISEVGISFLNLSTRFIFILPNDPHSWYRSFQKKITSNPKALKTSTKIAGLKKQQ